MEYIPKDAEFAPESCELETVKDVRGRTNRKIIRIGNELFRHYENPHTMSGSYSLSKMTSQGWKKLDSWTGADDRAGEHLEERDLKHFAKACYDY
jgi:hypothetical protein